MLQNFNVPIGVLFEAWGMYGNFPGFQRGEVWPLRKQRLLIDSILRGWPIPSIMCYQDGARFFIEDGRQRLTALRNFVNNEFYTLSEEDLRRMEPEQRLAVIAPHAKFRGLSKEVQELFLSYAIHFDQIDKSTMSAAEQGALFRRFQMGQPL